MARRQGKIERPKDEIEEEQEAIVTEEQEASTADE
jgi:hypothetical protein